MTINADKEKADLIDKIVQISRKSARGATAKRMEVFARQYLTNVPIEDIRDNAPADLYARVAGHWKFGAQRPVGKPLVRVFDPRQQKPGYATSHTVVEIVNDDMPFLVDSVAAEINRRGLTVHLMIHPIVKSRRDKNGKMQEVLQLGEPDAGTWVESFIHLEITEQPSSRHAEIKADVERVLSDVRAAVEDWRPMRERMLGAIEELQFEPKGTNPEDAHEVREFLRWIHDNHFTFLGFREVHFSGSGGKLRASADKTSGLGVLRNMKNAVFSQLRGEGPLAPSLRNFITKPSLVLITKADSRSTVHRSVHLDAIAVKMFDGQGRVVGMRIFVGLFTSVAYNRSPGDIPLLRRRMTKVIERSGFARASHDGKALLNTLETFPREELFQASDDYLFETALGILHLQERQRVALYVREDQFGRFITCLVFIPRENYNTDLRHTIQDILVEAFAGIDCSVFTQMGDSPLARLHFVIDTSDGKIPTYDAAKLEARLVEAARSWSDRIGGVLSEAFGEGKGLDLLHRYAGAFGPGYRDRYNANEVLDDITEIERVLSVGGVGMNLYRPEDAAADEIRFKIYSLDGAIPLSDVLPVFENMGFKVIDEGGPHLVNLSAAGRGRMVIHNFGLRARLGGGIDLKGIRGAFHDAFERVWDGAIESDGFNALVVSGGLSWREVVVLRAYCKYLRQTGIAFSQDYMAATMVSNPKLAANIVKLFMVLFDPDSQNAVEARAGRIRGQLRQGLESVTSADEDRIIQRFINLVDSTLRTNYFQKGAGAGTDTNAGKPYLSFKLNSQNVDGLPLPRPLREIFVYSPRVEGIHLRFGMVARGGLRWSDRPEDFRTEILGLVKAQQVKNAVIVPVGSKGGFVVKKPPTGGDRDAFMAEGIACYKTLIAGLLDLTDNIRGPKITPPPRVVRLDDDDTYLVVAADKGTATFSDIANGVSMEYGHWLGDAFASGGSQGYDHKKMGITARGGWESVKRHFRESGKDIQNEEFTVVGVGDMSGDVFGNGMLLSKKIKLLGAFNHMHIFVDPNPDPAKSWSERNRMFQMPRSSWTDYDAKRLSKGGAIFERSAKTLSLSKEIRDCFGIAKQQVTPDELLGYLLRAEVDLMWFGGIGTYVKSAAESHLDAGDRANDAIRVNGGELRCRVIGEGANLGCTQRGRIEFAAKGGRMNTDAIDNSAGVDSSDHEVNIKILVDSVVAAGGLSGKRRNALLASMTDQVGALVLVHNYRQSQAISLIQQRGVDALGDQQRLMRALERAGRLNRGVEYLPDDETVGERLLAKQGLYRPEISVLISYAKIWLYDELVASEMPDDPYLLADAIAYFPTQLQSKYAKQIAAHRLRREIVATRATNSLVDRVGETFVSELMEKTGQSAARIARAYVITREAFDLRDLWGQIDALDNQTPSATQTAMLVDINHLVEWVTLWFLRNGTAKLEIGDHIEAYRAGLQALVGGVTEALPPHYVADAHKRARPYMDNGVPEPLALRIAGLVNLYSGCDIVRLANRRRADVLASARTYFAVGTRFKLGRLRAAAEVMDSHSHWQKLAVAALIEEIYAHQLALSNKVCDVAGVKVNARQAVEDWIAANAEAVAPTEQLLAEIWATEVNDLSMIAVASRQIRAMIESGTG